MNLEKWFKEKTEELKGDPEYEFDGLLLELGERVARFLSMKIPKIDVKELKKYLGLSKRKINQVLEGDFNISIKTIVHLMKEFDMSININIEDNYLKEE